MNVCKITKHQNYVQLGASGIVLDKLPTITRSQDPADNFLLAMAEAGAADYLVTGDKRDVLSLKTHGTTHVVNATDMLKVLGVEIDAS